MTAPHGTAPLIISAIARRRLTRLPSTCRTNLRGPGDGPSATLRRYRHGPLYGWTDLTYLLHKYRVSWASYVQRGAADDCLSGPIKCYTSLKGSSTPGMWDPLPDFTDVRQDHQKSAAEEPLSRFYGQARRGRRYHRARP